MNKSLSLSIFTTKLITKHRNIHQTVAIENKFANPTNTMAGSDHDDASDHPAISKHLNMEDRGGRSNRRGRGGRGGGRGGGGGGGGQGREVQVSKALSKLLRHAAEEEGIQLDKEGFAKLDQVVCRYSLLFPRATATLSGNLEIFV